MHNRREGLPASSHEPPELGSCLSGNDATTLLEIIHKSISCNAEEDFKGLFTEIRELFSFDFAYAMLGRHDNNGMIMTHGVNISFPEEWLQEYVSKNYLHVDAIIRENFTNYQVQNWSITRKELYRKKEITSLGLDFGMRECYTHGWKPSTSRNNGSMFCFSSPTMKYDKRTETILEFVTPHLHLTLAHIFDRKRSQFNNIVLSAREKEVLDWLKQGKSSWDISVILDISERTVNFHVQNIMQKLDTSKRQQAVAVAVRLGLIDIN
jgi:DNA-binding CsgD family transcriptional regulator